MEMPKMSRHEFDARQQLLFSQQTDSSDNIYHIDDDDSYYNDDEDFNQGDDNRGPDHPWRWKWLILVILLVVGFLGFAEWQKFSQARQQIFATKSEHLNAKVQQKKPISVLAMGTDVGALNRGNAGGNTDSLELFTLNPKTQTITMTSLPRDILVRVNTKEGPDYVKLNAAYSINGPKQTVKQVSELLDVPIDYYAVINMGVLQKVVDSVGGVDVNNPFAFDYEGHHFPKGLQHLNGVFALKYSRMRYDDPNNDYGRQNRQQQILTSVIKNFRSNGSLTAVNQILDAVGDGVKTNVPVNEIKPLYKIYMPALKHVSRQHFQGQNAMIEGVSFQIASTAEINRVSKLTRQQLGLKPKKVINHETRMFDSQPDYQGNNDSPFILPGHAKYNTPGSGTGSDKVETKQDQMRVQSEAMTLTNVQLFGAK